MEIEKELEQLSYLWKNKEEWSLSQHHYSLLSISVLFSSDKPNIREIASLRKLSDKFQHIPVEEMKQLLGNNSEYNLGIMERLEADSIIRKAKDLNINIKIKDCSYISYLPINVKQNHTLIIENEELANLVAERMLKAGIPIIEQIEID